MNCILYLFIISYNNNFSDELVDIEYASELVSFNIGLCALCFVLLCLPLLLFFIIFHFDAIWLLPVRLMVIIQDGGAGGGDGGGASTIGAWFISISSYIAFHMNSFPWN